MVCLIVELVERPRKQGKAETAALLSAQGIELISSADRETETLERRLSDLVNAAYGLTPADIDLMWRTAPPRMPIKPPTQ